MFMEWWRTRQPREKMLIGVAGIITSAIVLFQFLLIPSNSFKEREARRFQSQSGLYTEVISKLREHGNSAQQKRANANGPVQGIVSDSSSVYGISITRIEPTPSGDLTLWIDEIDPQSLYAWLTDLELNYGISVSKASIRMNKDTQTVNANIFVSRGA